MKLLLIICKFIGWVLEKMGKGSTFPGRLAYKLNKNILNYFKVPDLVIAVTGSAGKGNTSGMIADLLENNNKKVVHNKSGSNMLPGILSLLIKKSDLKGTISEKIIIK